MLNANRLYPLNTHHNFLTNCEFKCVQSQNKWMFPNSSIKEVDF